MLNAANFIAQKFAASQEVKDLQIALNFASLSNFHEDDLRYENIIIITYSDAYGAHITHPLITLFYFHMRKMIENGQLYQAKLPLYFLVQVKKLIMLLMKCKKLPNQMYQKIQKQDKGRGFKRPWRN